MNHPIVEAMDKLIADQNRRHAWLYEAGEQVRKWKEEDRLKGEPWGANAADAAPRSHASHEAPPGLRPSGFDRLSRGERK